MVEFSAKYYLNLTKIKVFFLAGTYANPPRFDESPPSKHFKFRNFIE